MKKKKTQNSTSKKSDILDKIGNVDNSTKKIIENDKSIMTNNINNKKSNKR